MNRKTTFVSLCCGLVALAGLFPAPALAQRMIARPGVAGPGGTVRLPYTVADNAGNQWRVYQYGQLQQSGNNPLYSRSEERRVGKERRDRGTRTDEQRDDR